MSHLIKWSPFFDQFDNSDAFFKEASSLVPSNHGLIPPVDMYDSEDKVVVETPLPGADTKNVSVEIENGILTIKGSSERKTEVDEKNYYRKEIRSGQIFRQIALPANVDDKAASATYENGILKVQIPKLSDTSSKSIKIDVKKND